MTAARSTGAGGGARPGGLVARRAPGPKGRGPARHVASAPVRTVEDVGERLRHELKQPIVVIRLMAQVLEREETPADRRRRCARLIVRCADRVTTMIDDVTAELARELAEKESSGRGAGRARVEMRRAAARPARTPSSGGRGRGA